MQEMPPERHMVPVENSHQAVYQTETGMDRERERKKKIKLPLDVRIFYLWDLSMFLEIVPVA